MPFVIRTGRHIVVTRDLAFDDLRVVLACLYDATHNKGYQDLLLDFSACTKAFASTMVAECAQCCKLHAEGISTDLVLPQSAATERLFLDSNWAHLIDPTHFGPSTFRGYRQVAATQFRDPPEQQKLINRLIDAILKSLDDIERKDLAAIEWAMNELTDNVLNHSASSVGGFAQLSTFKERKKIDLVVGDPGQGIPATLRPIFPNLDDYNLLERATHEGITRSKEFQGNGLYGSERICSISGGYFRLHSGHGELKRDGSGALLLKNQRIPLVGTLVDVCISYADANVLQQALRFGGRSYSPVDFLERSFETDPTESINFDLRREAASLGSRSAGSGVRTKIGNLVRMVEKKQIAIDLRGIPIISSSFADEAFAKLYSSLGKASFNSRLYFLGANNNVAGLIKKAITQRVGQEAATVPFH